MPLHFDEDLQLAERILIEAARNATADVVREGRAAIDRMRERFPIHTTDLDPRVYLRITDNWVELTVRFLVEAYGVRELKDVSRARCSIGSARTASRSRRPPSKSRAFPRYVYGGRPTAGPARDRCEDAAHVIR